MRALHFVGGGKVEVEEYPTPQPDDDQVLVKVVASGICGSELGTVRSEEGAEMNGGHEVAGIIADPNGHPQFEEGDRVGVFTLQGCGKCRWCRIGRDTYCSDMSGPSATHAEYCTSRAHSLTKLADDVPFSVAVLLCADGLGVPYGATSRADIGEYDITCVFGAGPIGLGMTLVQSYFGANVIISEPSAARRNLAKKMGAWQTLDPGEIGDMAGTLKQMTDGYGPDVCFECCGRQDTLDAALEATRPEGLIVMVGHGPQSMNPQKLIVKRNLRMMGNWVVHPSLYPEMLELYREGLDAERLITAEYPYEDAQQAYDEMLEARSGKVLLRWDG